MTFPSKSGDFPVRYVCFPGGMFLCKQIECSYFHRQNPSFPFGPNDSNDSNDSIAGGSVFAPTRWALTKWALPSPGQGPSRKVMEDSLGAVRIKNHIVDGEKI